MSKFTAALVAIALMFVASRAQAAIIDDFNVNEGHFNVAPTFSSTSTISSASTANRITTDSFEGAGSEEVVIVMSTASPARMRFLSGGGAVASNVILPFTAGVDGWVGLYAKATGSPSMNGGGAKLQLALDDPGNVLANMVGTRPITLATDGLWHLYEWNMDVASDWASLAGLTSNANPGTMNRTIDSIYIPASVGITSGFTLLVDFVAHNPSGSIADLIPEPTSLGLFALAGISLVRRRRVRLEALPRIPSEPLRCQRTG